MIIKVVTLGCKVNQCESASIVATLTKHGYEASEGLEPADVYVLNTCSVTAEADKKSRQYLTKMRKLNPNCAIIVIGCSAQNAYSKFMQKNIIAIGGTTDKSRFILSIIDNHTKNLCDSIICDTILYDKNCENIAGDVGYCYENYPIFDKTRAFVKIQDGCNRFCTYCIIPYLRGRSRSRAIYDIVNECRGITSKEIVLTGIDISSYGVDLSIGLVDLISALVGIDARKRLGSLECEAVDERLLDAMATDNFCPHFHLSLQNGSNNVLKSMNRRYNTEYFYGKIKLIREYFPNAGITTDIIAGFPTETDNDFDTSCRFIEQCGFSDIHVFPYSARKGTLAARKYQSLPPNMVNARTDKLLEMKHTLHNRFISKNIGTIAPVYVEASCGEYNVGLTPNYIKVYSKAQCGEIVDLKLTKTFGDGLLGE